MRTITFLLALFPAAALAQSAADTNAMTSLLPLILIFFVFYFLLIRPQQKRISEHQRMIEAIKKGDEVVTAGGVVGKITKVEDDGHVLVQIASGVEIKVVKATLSSVGPRVQPAKPAHQEKQSKANRNDNALPAKDSVANDN